MLKIPSISIEYVKVPITGPGDYTSLDVDMAVVPKDEPPESGDWKSAVWIGSNAAVLIGTGSDVGVLTRGVTYDIWVKITSSPETPVLGPVPLHIT